MGGQGRNKSFTMESESNPPVWLVRRKGRLKTPTRWTRVEKSIMGKRRTLDHNPRFRGRRGILGLIQSAGVISQALGVCR